MRNGEIRACRRIVDKSRWIVRFSVADWKSVLVQAFICYVNPAPDASASGAGFSQGLDPGLVC
jgi:hypothetical protein